MTVVPNWKSRQERLHILAHEICHRQVMQRHSLARRPWIAEMLAELAARRVLCEEGSAEYAKQVAQNWNDWAPPLSVTRLKWIRRHSSYPDGLYTGSVRVGTQLEALIGWEALCGLATYHTWREWLNTLPEEERAQVRRLLHL